MARTALVTGAGQRIGRAIAAGLAEDGYALAIHYNTSREPAEALAREIDRAGGTAVTLRQDLSEPASAGALVAEAAEMLGPVSLLVNSASVYGGDSLASLSAERLAQFSNVNFAAPVMLMQAFAAQDRAAFGQEGGAVVNILDVQLDAPSPAYFSYFCAKAALATATRLAALELAPEIRVNAVAPGLVLPSGGQSEDEFAARQALTPMGAGLAVHDIVEAVRYLARARQVTGHVLPVDSGQRLMGFGNADVRPLPSDGRA